jgi:hypothetical protein
VPGFIAAQLVGALVALLVARTLFATDRVKGVRLRDQGISADPQRLGDDQT